MVRVSRAVDWMFRDRATGRVVVAQWPNLALWAWIVVRLLRVGFDPGGDIGTALSVVGAIALLWWAADEVLRGVNPWRRILGTVVGLATLVGLVW